MATARLMPNGKQQFFDVNGDPLSGGKLYTYASGTTTPKATYADSGMVTPNANPVVLDSRGEATIFWNGAYKAILKDSGGSEIWTVDGFSTDSDAGNVTYNSVALDSILKNNSVYVVSTINDLRAVDKTKYTNVFVRGYYAAGDGGGGMYRYDSTDTTSSDNYGTIIVASDSGRWKLYHNGRVSLLQFGAKQDLSFDSTTYVQAALDAMAGGGEVLVDGEFYCATTVTAPDFVNIVGYIDSPTTQKTGVYNSTTIPSIIVLANAASIKGKCFSINGVMVINYNLSSAGTYPTPLTIANGAAAYAAFSGTAIKASATTGYYNSQVISVKNCIILGFSQAIDGRIGSSADSLINVDNCLIDCTNGIKPATVSNGNDWNVVTNTRICVVVGLNATFGYGKTTGEGISLVTDAMQVNLSNVVIKDCATGIHCDGDGQIVRISNSKIKATTGILYDTSSAGNSDLMANNVEFVCTTDLSFNGVGDAKIANCTGIGSIVATSITTCSVLNSNVTPSMVSGTEAAKVVIFPFNQASWTPVVKIGSVSPSTQTYSTQVGRYSIAGNIVHFYARIVLSALNDGVAADDVTITGLPFTSSSTSNLYGVCSVPYFSGCVTVDSITGTIAPSSTVITLYQTPAAGAATVALDKQDLSATSELILAGHYLIDIT